MTPIIDTHCHFEWEGFDSRRDALISRARAVGVRQWFLPGTDRDSLLLLPDLCRRYHEFRMLPGIHPLYAEQWNDGTRTMLLEALAQPTALGIGEIGLDRQIDVEPGIQQRALAGQLELAAEFGLPVMLHVRRAHQRVMEMLAAAGIRRVIWHSYSGSAEFLRQAQARGHYFSFSGAITNPRAKKYPAIFEMVRTDRLLIETDAPDISPHPHAGRECLPEYISLTLKRMSELTNLDTEELTRRLYRNTVTAFNLEPDHESI